MGQGPWVHHSRGSLLEEDCDGMDNVYNVDVAISLTLLGIISSLWFFNWTSKIIHTLSSKPVICWRVYENFFSSHGGSIEEPQRRNYAKQSQANHYIYVVDIVHPITKLFKPTSSWVVNSRTLPHSLSPLSFHVIINWHWFFHLSKDWSDLLKSLWELFQYTWM